jgi:hypothetical protein
MKILLFALLLLTSLIAQAANWRELQIMTNGVMAGTGAITSTAVDLRGYSWAALQVAYTGTPTGTITVSGSLDNVTYYPLTFNPVLTQPSGGAGGYLIQLAPLSYPYIQAGYTNTSGSGTLNINLFSKALAQ